MPVTLPKNIHFISIQPNTTQFKVDGQLYSKLEMVKKQPSWKEQDRVAEEAITQKITTMMATAGNLCRLQQRQNLDSDMDKIIRSLSMFCCTLAVVHNWTRLENPVPYKKWRNSRFRPEWRFYKMYEQGIYKPTIIGLPIVNGMVGRLNKGYKPDMINPNPTPTGILS